MDNNLVDVKYGDIIYIIPCGRGKVVGNVNDVVAVELLDNIYKGVYKYYTLDGKEIRTSESGNVDNKEEYPSAFIDKELFFKYFKKDEVVLVYLEDSLLFEIRYYSHYDKNSNTHYVFKEGLHSSIAGVDDIYEVNSEKMCAYDVKNDFYIKNNEIVKVGDVENEYCYRVFSHIDYKGNFYCYCGSDLGDVKFSHLLKRWKFCCK